MQIKAEKDFWTGLAYVGLGLCFLVIGWNYRMGTGARMGPGYFPIVLSCALIGLGLASFGRSFVSRGGRIGGIAWKPAAMIILATIAFGLLLRPLGLVFSLVALCFMSFRASRRFKIDGIAVMGLAGLIVFCVVVFIKGLGVPMPIFGEWFEPYVPQFLIR